MFSISARGMDHLSDDRLGRALDHLSDADGAALLTEVTLAVGERFGVKFDEFHNDSASVMSLRKMQRCLGPLDPSTKRTCDHILVLDRPPPRPQTTAVHSHDEVLSSAKPQSPEVEDGRPQESRIAIAKDAIKVAATSHDDVTRSTQTLGKTRRTSRLKGHN